MTLNEIHDLEERLSTLKREQVLENRIKELEKQIIEPTPKNINRMGRRSFMKSVGIGLLVGLGLGNATGYSDAEKERWIELNTELDLDKQAAEFHTHAEYSELQGHYNMEMNAASATAQYRADKAQEVENTNREAAKTLITKEVALSRCGAFGAVIGGTLQYCLGDSERAISCRNAENQKESTKAQKELAEIQSIILE